MINMIAAISLNNGIGINNELPWNIKEDLKYFKTVTTNQVVLMGRKTFESIGRPLPNRINLVLTRDKNFVAKGVTIVHSLEEAFALFSDYEDVFIIGGSEIYNLFLDKADCLYLTLVEKEIEADAFFPNFKENFSKEDESEKYYSEASDCYFSFTKWNRK